MAVTSFFFLLVLVNEWLPWYPRCAAPGIRLRSDFRGSGTTEHAGWTQNSDIAVRWRDWESHPCSVFLFSRGLCTVIQHLCFIWVRIGCTLWSWWLFFPQIIQNDAGIDWTVSISKPYDGRFNQRGNPVYQSSKRIQAWCSKYLVQPWKKRWHNHAFNSCDDRGGEKTSKRIPVVPLTM